MALDSKKTFGLKTMHIISTNHIHLKKLDSLISNFPNLWLHDILIMTRGHGGIVVFMRKSICRCVSHLLSTHADTHIWIIIQGYQPIQI